MATMTKEKKKKWAAEIIDALAKAYPDAGCALEHVDVYQLLVAVTLSAQTTDVSVNKITPALFEKYPTPAAMAQADPKDIMKLIRTIGLYKTKSQRIIDQAKKLVEDFDGIVPEDDKLLQSLPGVGRKTANVVMADGFGHQRIAVDTHVFRVSNRIGLAKADDVLKTELALLDVLPKDHQTLAHHCLIFHGRRCCSARKPKCRECPIESLCQKNGV